VISFQRETKAYQDNGLLMSCPYLSPLLQKLILLFSAIAFVLTVVS
jgi:hypothetical protein